MSRSRRTEAEMIAALKQVEAGRSTEDVAREQGVSKHTIYASKAKYGGMEVNEAEEVKHLRDEKRFRVLGAIDRFTRHCLAPEVATSFPSRRVTRILERSLDEHGKPQSIRSENGPELSSRHYLAWAIERKIDLLPIQPGKPTQNGGMESFNGKLRDECLNVSRFWNLFDARRKISTWKPEYNSPRPHSSPGYLTPDDFARRRKKRSYGKDAGCARLQNAPGVSHFPTAPTATMNLV